ncbi:DUF6354 family protein [Streptomyces aurantiogriseus]|uniref:DUF6354 family protein n=1 Tax=Streptomyces aurantiogriseus TaxID=66870 RepID=UPI001675B37D|nr:DUF6354 family protein [Streptomyces aurantiogriseus]
MFGQARLRHHLLSRRIAPLPASTATSYPRSGAVADANRQDGTALAVEHDRGGQSGKKTRASIARLRSHAFERCRTRVTSMLLSSA